MGSKVKCPACGAKNDAASYRCRMCTVVINPEAAEAAPEPAAEAAPRVDHFDAGVIDRQLQPARSKFGDDAGGLAARLAAARQAKATNQPIHASAPPASGPEVAPSVAPAGGGAVEPFEPVDLSEMQSRTAPPTAPPIEHEAEPFDPDALFRDMS